MSPRTVPRDINSSFDGLPNSDQRSVRQFSLQSGRDRPRFQSRIAPPWERKDISAALARMTLQDQINSQQADFLASGGQKDAGGTGVYYKYRQSSKSSAIGLPLPPGKEAAGRGDSEDGEVGGGESVGGITAESPMGLGTDAPV